MATADKRTTKRKVKKNVVIGDVHIFASYNNTIVTVTDLQGNTLAWSSSGAHGFKGSKKSTPYASQIATEHAMNNAKEHGLKTVTVYVKGPGTGRESAVRAVASSGINVTAIRDVTPTAHNGCRPRKKRRV